jgi:hypothetical protein
MTQRLRFIILEDGETFGGFDNAQMVSILDDTPGLDAALESEDAAGWLLDHGTVTALSSLRADAEAAQRVRVVLEGIAR